MSAQEQPEAAGSAYADDGEDIAAQLSQYTSYESTPDEALELFDEARERCPVPHSEKLDGYHLLLDYEDIRDAHRDWETFASSPQVLRPIAERPQFPPLEYDPPEQTEWRELFAKALNRETPKLVEGDVRADAVRLIDALPRGETFDLVEDVAEEIALLALCYLLGFDQEKRREVRRHTIEMHATADDPEKGPAAFVAFAEFGAKEVMARLEDPREDFLTDLSRAQIQGRALTPIELGATMNSFLNAGHGTTVAGMTSLFYEVLSRPDVRAALIEDPELIPAATEEALRLHTPFFGLYRRATRATTVSGTEIPEGGSVLMCWAAGNRDPKEFPEPDAFKLDRANGRQHMTFGFGIHACMGSPLARMEMNVALTELLARVPDIELVEPEKLAYRFGGSETARIPTLPARIPGG